TGPSGQVEDAGIVGCDQQIATVRSAGEHLLDLDVLPVAAAVAAAEHGDLGGDVDGARRGGADLYGVQVEGIVAEVGAVDQRGPALATVPAAEQAPDFDGSVHVERVRGIGRDADDTL